MLRPRTTQPFPVQLLDLTLIQLANWRWSWRGQLLTGIIAPVLTTGMLSMFASGRDPETLAYILTGNMVMSLLFGTFDRVAGHFAYMRMVGRLDFFATLPIYRSALIVATVIAFLALSLPSLLLTLLFGMVILDLPLVISPWILVVIPVTGCSLCGLGTLIGIITRTPETAVTYSTLITFLLMGSGPVIVPLDRLPGVMQWLSLLSPATYAASALRQTVLDLPDRIPLGVDLAVLGLFLAGSLWIVGRHMDWRQA